MSKSIIRRVGTRIMGSTLMTVISKDFPLKRGNRFSLKMHDEKIASVQNMSAEDFKEICDIKKISTVEVLYLTDSGTCFIIDHRVPRDWLTPLSENTIQNASDEIPVIGEISSDAGFFYAPYIPKFFTTVYENESTLDFEIEIKGVEE